eukprot:gene10096-biopygen11916
MAQGGTGWRERMHKGMKGGMREMAFRGLGGGSEGARGRVPVRVEQLLADGDPRGHQRAVEIGEERSDEPPLARDRDGVDVAAIRRERGAWLSHRRWIALGEVVGAAHYDLRMHCTRGESQHVSTYRSMPDSFNDCDDTRDAPRVSEEDEELVPEVARVLP